MKINIDAVGLWDLTLTVRGKDYAVPEPAAEVLQNLPDGSDGGDFNFIAKFVHKVAPGVGELDPTLSLNELLNISLVFKAYLMAWARKKESAARELVEAPAARRSGS